MTPWEDPIDDTSDVTPVEDRMDEASDETPVEDAVDESTDFMCDLLFHQLDSMDRLQRMKTFHPQDRVVNGQFNEIAQLQLIYSGCKKLC